MLRAVAMLASNVARFFGMRFGLLARECDTDVEPQLLPRTDSDLMEKHKAAERGPKTCETLAPKTDEAMPEAGRWTETAMSSTGIPTGTSMFDRNAKRLPVRRGFQQVFHRCAAMRTRTPSTHRVAPAPG